MSASPVRVAIASADEVLAQGLRRMLASQAHRVVVVEPGHDQVDVVLHDGAHGDEPVPGRAGAAPRVPLQDGVEQIVALVEAAARSSWRDDDAVGLTPREMQVLVMITEGLTNQEIADRLFVSINSVKTYVRSAYRKIDVNSRSQAAVWCLHHGVAGRGGPRPPGPLSAGRGAR